MIYSLRGKLIEVGESAAVVECAGVGYLCSTTRTTLNSLPPKGSEVMLYTYLNIREGAVDLFGFSTLAEQRCFRQLTSVSGVGPKVALGILSELKPDQLMLSLVSQDVKSLTRAPGVGKSWRSASCWSCGIRSRTRSSANSCSRSARSASRSLPVPAMWPKRCPRWWFWATARARRRAPWPVSRRRQACRS